jgi:integrase
MQQRLPGEWPDLVLEALTWGHHTSATGTTALPEVSREDATEAFLNERRRCAAWEEAWGQGVTRRQTPLELHLPGDPPSAEASGRRPVWSRRQRAVTDEITTPPRRRQKTGRRDPGDGAIFKRGDGRWVARLRLPDRTQRYFYGKAKEEVRTRLKEAQRALDDGTPVPNERMSLGAFLERWLAGLAATNLKPRTITYYQSYVANHIVRTELAGKPLARITPTDLKSLYARKLASGLSPTSVHHLHAVIHRALAVAVRDGEVARNIADLVDGPGFAKTEMRVLEDDEPERFLVAVAGHPLEALFVLAMTSGLRQGELLARRWPNVDLDLGDLEVIGSLSGRRRADLQIVTPKAGKGRRVSLARPAIEALREHRQRQRELRIAVGSKWVDRGLVFANETTAFGDYLGPASLNRALDRTLGQAGLPRIRFHELRHTAATRVLSRGVHPKVAAEMLGLSSISVILDRYSHITATMQREAVRQAWGGDAPTP